RSMPGRSGNSDGGRRELRAGRCGREGHGYPSMSEPPVLEAHDLCASYRRQPVLHGVDLALPRGVLAGLLGPNGAGKSSFLKAAMGELEPDSGWVKLFGRPVEKARRRVAYVPQRESVDWDFPVTVAD